MNTMIGIIFLKFIISQVQGLKFSNSVRIPRIDLGEVDLSDTPNCENQLKKHRYECEANYRKAVIEELVRHQMYERSESVKLEVCCGIWRAKACVIKAANEIPECGDEVVKRYHVLPTDPHIEEEVADMCSEYREDSVICSQPESFTSGIFILALILLLLLIIVYFICLFNLHLIFGIFVFYS
jgi:hypothetical protein